MLEAASDGDIRYSPMFLPSLGGRPNCPNRPNRNDSLDRSGRSTALVDSGGCVASAANAENETGVDFHAIVVDENTTS